MEDLVDYYLPPPTRPWTQPEGECIARAYARFHVSGVQHLPPEGERAWLLPRHETRLQTENIGELAHDLFQRDVWDTIPEIDSLIEQTICNSRSLSQIPITLLHNDVFPPNVALPPILENDAILLDWEMVSFGLPEMDLAFMFIQPFRAHRLLDKTKILDIYWETCLSLGGKIPSQDERETRQFYADAVWGLWLIPVAHKMTIHPYPPDSSVADYWKSMMGVLYEHLARLSRLVLL
jgi:thiamine kinase-like enzyme